MKLRGVMGRRGGAVTKRMERRGQGKKSGGADDGDSFKEKRGRPKGEYECRPNVVFQCIGPLPDGSSAL